MEFYGHTWVLSSWLLTWMLISMTSKNLYFIILKTWFLQCSRFVDTVTVWYYFKTPVSVMGKGHLMPLSTICQLYRGHQLYILMEKTAHHWQILSHKKMYKYPVHLAMGRNQTHNFSGDSQHHWMIVYMDYCELRLHF